MSTTDFNNTASLSIGVTVSGTGQFYPFGGGQTQPMNWTLEGEMKMKSVSKSLLKGCGKLTTESLYYTTFSAGNSVGSNSGTVEIGRFLINKPAIIGQAEHGQTTFGGIWKFNTEPVLSAGGLVNGEPAEYFYIVQRPASVETVDDPILIEPPIDNLKRIYEGDLIFADQDQWHVAPQQRFPKTDRTFFWEPNTEPVLKAGGIIDDKLAKPGTIMLPDENYYIPKSSDGFDGMRYFYENQGVMFDGQAWAKLLPDPTVFKIDEATTEFREFDLRYLSPQRFELSLESDHRDKGFATGYMPIDYGEPFTFTETPEEGDPIVTNFYFYWTSPVGGADGAFPSNRINYDFGDAWSKYWAANLAWIKARPKFTSNYESAGFYLKSKNESTGEGEPSEDDPILDQPELVLNLFVRYLEDGNVTVIEEKTTNDEGQEFINKFTITTSLTVEQT